MTKLKLASIVLDLNMFMNYPNSYVINLTTNFVHRATRSSALKQLGNINTNHVRSTPAKSIFSNS